MLSKTHFWSQNLVRKPQNSPKSICCESLVVESWLIPQNDQKTWFTMGVLKYVFPSDNWTFTKNIFLWFLGPYNDEVVWILYLMNHWSLVDFSKWLQEWIYYKCSKICITLRQPKNTLKMYFFFFFLQPYITKLHAFPYLRKMGHIKFVDPLIFVRYVYLSDDRKCPNNVFFVPFGPYMIEFQKLTY